MTVLSEVQATAARVDSKVDQLIAKQGIPEADVAAIGVSLASTEAKLDQVLAPPATAEAPEAPQA